MQQSSSQFSLVQSGYGFTLQNSVGVGSGGSLTVSYTISGGPSSLSVVIEGGKNSGARTIIDSYSGVSNTSRSITLGDTFDYFVVTPTWAGGSDVAIQTTVTFSGAGLTQTAVTVTLPLSGVGSPQNVVSAPLGSMYLNISGGSSQVLWIKESGGSGNTGWVNK